MNLLERNVTNTKHYVFTISKGAQGNLLINLTCLINRGIRNLITLVPRACLFVDKGEDFILVLFCKAKLERKDICASVWLKPPISMLSNSFNIVKIKYCIKNIYQFYPQIKFMPFIMPKFMPFINSCHLLPRKNI